MRPPAAAVLRSVSWACPGRTDAKILKKSSKDNPRVQAWMTTVSHFNFFVPRQMLTKASAARVDRRLLRYYLIVRRLPNVFALACRSLGSIYYDTGSPQDGKTPFGWLHPCRLVTDSRRYLIVGASAATPLHSSFIFSLNNRASTIS